MNVKFRVEAVPQQEGKFGLKLTYRDKEHVDARLQKWVEQFSGSKELAEAVAKWFNSLIENEENMQKYFLIPTIKKYETIFCGISDFENIYSENEKFDNVIQQLNEIDGLRVETSDGCDYLLQKIQANHINVDAVLHLSEETLRLIRIREARKLSVNNVPLLVFVTETGEAVIIKPVILPLYERVCEQMNVKL